MLSIVIPAYNEQDSVKELYDKISSVLKGTEHEAIFVDDGSTDDTFKELTKLDVKIVRLQRNFGKSAALQAGFDHAKGNYIIQMDADLQDDPKDILEMLEGLDFFDMVNGWRANRQDKGSKKFVSKIYNKLTSKIVGLDLDDYNCGFKAYKREVIDNLHIYGEQHRYIPALAHFNGFTVGEMVVRHHPRKHGTSKYSSSRIFRGMMDLLSIKFHQQYGKRPLHFFGLLGLGSFVLGVLAGLYLIMLKLQGYAIGERPMLVLAMVLLMIGAQFISLGLIGEMITKESQQKGYIIKEVVG